MRITKGESARLWKNIEIKEENECWPWLGKIPADGYPRVSIQGKRLTVAQAVFMDKKGEISSGYRIEKTCGDKECCNFKHCVAVPKKKISLTKGHSGVKTKNSKPFRYTRDLPIRDEIDPVQQARFWRKVCKSDGPDACWPWLGTSTGGYGSVSINGQRHRATRIAYILEYGSFPDGMYACHKCDNPLCANPTHIFPGTPSENSYDMHSKNRGPKNPATGDRNGARTQPERLTRGEDHWMRKNPERVPRGEDRAMSKLTWEKVRALRASYTKGATQKALAEEYDLHQSTVSDIVRAETWQEAGVVDISRGHTKNKKLTDEQVTWAKEMYKTGEMSQRAMGRELGVNQTTIRNAVLS